MRSGDVRRVGRSGAAKAAARAFRSRLAWVPRAALPAARLCAHENERRRFSQEHTAKHWRRRSRAGKTASKREDFLNQLHYFSGDYDDPESFQRLAQRLEELDSEGQLGRQPPVLSGHAAGCLSARDPAARQCANLAQPKSEKSWTRIIIEKPFGHDGAIGAGAEQKSAGSFRGIAGLSHRPLSRQGDGAEHAGVSVRQRHF